jgi:hypothetical protein
VKINLPYSTLESSKNLKHNDRAYANCLALYAVDWYLKCLQFSTKLVQQDDWLLKYISESATLEVVGVGLLECIPTIGNTQTAQMPIDSQSNRVGYLFVRLNDELTSAEIIGFTPNYAQEVRLDRLQSTEDLIEYLCDMQSTPVLKLGEWLQGIITAGWEVFDNLIPPPSLAYRGDVVVSPSAPNLEDRLDGVRIVSSSVSRSIKKAGHQIKLGKNPDSRLVFLTVEQDSIEDDNHLITIEINPPQNAIDRTLPVGLRLIVISDEGDEISEIEMKTGDTEGKIVLNAEPGEKFSIKLKLNDFYYVQKVQISSNLN